MREVVLDTETTGLDPTSGHRIVEIGCIELMHHVPTGENYHRYLNPERAMPADAQGVHGLTDAFLADKPVFAEVVDAFLAFIGDSPLVIHNAAFDMSFLNAELTRLGLSRLSEDRAIDTLRLARRRFPGAHASLDALCSRFGIDNSGRAVHGALLDATLLADVYLELRGGRQPGLALANRATTGSTGGAIRIERPARPHAPSPEDVAAHEAFLAELKDPIWQS